jgi:hypothetical protein
MKKEISELLSEVSKNENLTSSKGGHRVSLYKEEIYQDLKPVEKKRLRNKLRKLTLNFLSSMLSEKDDNKINSLFQDFVKYYKGIYKNQNIKQLEFSDLFSNNLSEDKKEIVNNSLKIINNRLSQSPTVKSKKR